MGSSLTGNVGKELSRPVAKMIRNILLLSLVALATSTTITITTDGNTLTCGADFCSGASPVPTAEEIKLVRDSWPIIKKNKAVLSEFVLEHFRVHPKTQELLPELAQVALADLPTHPYFVTLSETYVVLAMNEMIDNLDNAGVLSKLLECLHPEWYVDYVSIERAGSKRRLCCSCQLRLRCGYLHRHQLGQRTDLDSHSLPANQARAVRRLRFSHPPAR